MSVLRRHARSMHPTLTEKYTTRISKEDADLFDEWCRKFNMSPSEALRLLIIEELGVLRRQMSSSSSSMSTNVSDKSSKGNLKKDKRPQKTSVAGKQKSKERRNGGFNKG